MAAAAASFTNILTNLNYSSTVRAGIIANVGATDEIRELTAEDIRQVAKNIRDPGGVNPNPAHAAALDAGNPVVGIPVNLRNPGVAFGLGSARTLDRLRFFCFHYHYHLSLAAPTGATVSDEAILITTYRFYEQYRVILDKDTPPIPAKYSPSKLKETLDNLEECFHRTYGAIGAPLSYVVRPETAAPAVADRANIGTEWPLVIACARHDGRYWITDNESV